MSDGVLWYGGCRLVTGSVSELLALVALCDGAEWNGLILSLHTETEAHYVAFCCFAASGWHFFDPDTGVVLPAPMLGASNAVPGTRSLPSGLFFPSRLLQRTLYRFKLGLPAFNAIKGCSQLYPRIATTGGASSHQ